MSLHRKLTGADLHAPSNQQIENTSGSTIPALYAVTFSGTGVYPKIVPVTSINDAVRGVTPVALADGECGYITCLGFINNVNTSAYNVGDKLYASAGGALSTTVFGLPIAYVMKKDATTGILYVTNTGVSAPDLSLLAPVQSVAGKVGAVLLNKSDVGLSNVDNTSDLNKPISTATQTALDSKVNFITTSTSISGDYYGDINNPSGTFTITGPTVIYGNVNCYQLNINADLQIKGSINAFNIIVSNYTSVTIEGSTIAQTFDYSSTIDLNGDLYFYGPVKIDTLNFRSIHGTATISFYEDAVVNLLRLVDPTLDSASSNSLYAYKNLYCGDIFANGADCNTNINGFNQAGNGGSIYCDYDIFANNIYADGGNNNFVSTTDIISAGTSGTVYSEGGIYASNIYISGGNQNSASIFGGSAGNGGTIYCKRLNFSSLIQANGGNNLSGSDFAAGNAGTIYGDDEIFGGSIIATSGSRTSSSVVSSQASASVIFSNGNISLISANLNGGDMTASSGSALAGNGGNITSNGNLFLRTNGTFTLSGGVGGALNSGGNGGSIVLQSGSMTGGDVTLNGGSGGLQPGFAGLIQVRRGIDMGAINLLDGSGTPTNSISGLQFNGNAIIRRLNFANRTNSRVRPWQSEPAVLRCWLMPSKNTIATSSGIESSSLSTLLTANIFMTNASGTWIRIAGVTI